MDLRGWLRRKKPSDKGPCDSGSISSHSEENENTKDASENLSASVLNISVKEELLKHQSKIAEDAVAGWEKAEREVSGLKLQLDASLKKNLALEDRVSHLDGALKECVRQLRREREEQGRNIEETVAKRTCEFESRECELDNRVSELRTQLDKAKSEAAASTDGLRHKLEAAEKDNTSLRMELIALRKKLEVTTLERDWSTQTAETSSKQRLDCIKKVAKLEAECRMLKFSTRNASSSDDHTAFTRSSTYVDSLIDSQSDYGERLQSLETDEVGLQGPLVGRSAYLEEKIKTLEAEKVELEMALDESHGHLNVSQGRLQDATIRSVNLEAQLMECQTQLRRSEERLKATKTDFTVLQKQLIGSQTKLNDTETELMELQTQLIEHEDQVSASKGRLKEAEVNLEELTNRLKDAEIKLIELRNELLEREDELVKLRVESLAREDELRRSQGYIKDTETRLMEMQSELNNNEVEQTKEIDTKLVELDTDELEYDGELEASNARREEVELPTKGFESERDSLQVKVWSLVDEAEKEGALSVGKFCPRLMQSHLHRGWSCNTTMKAAQEKELAVAASKLEECQKTIASLGRQLESLAVIDGLFINDGKDVEVSRESPIFPSTSELRSLPSIGCR